MNQVRALIFVMQMADVPKGLQSLQQQMRPNAKLFKQVQGSLLQLIQVWSQAKCGTVFDARISHPLQRSAMRPYGGCRGIILGFQG